MSAADSEVAVKAAALGADGAEAAVPREVELKFRLDDLSAGERYLEAGSLAGLTAGGAIVSVVDEDRYIDTRSGALAKAGYVGRLRRRNGTVLVTLKTTELPADGLADRAELEAPAGPLAHPDRWPPSEARTLLLGLRGEEPLTEVVRLRQRRRQREFGDGSTVVEVSLDEAEVIEGGSVVGRFGELEVELRRGEPGGLAPIRETLSSDPALRPADRSKLETALAVARQRPARPSPRALASGIPVGATPGVVATDTLAEAGRKVLRFHFARMLVREDALRDPEKRDIEDLHAMRVAVRRMRAAWQVFGDGFQRGDTKRLRARLGVVADRLGTVRDLDVLLDAARGYVETDRPGDAEGLAPLLEGWLDERATADQRLMAELDSPGYDRWRDEYRLFVLTDGLAAGATSPTAPHRVRDAAGSQLWALLEEVRGYEDVVRWADVATLHQLRIAGKHLRYALEFLREALAIDMSGLIQRVVALQDHLGALHDADVAAGRARALLVASSDRMSATERAAIARYLGSRERDVARLRRTAYRPYAAVISSSSRRRLGRALATL